jgi:predicted small metal-binding protein
MPSFRCADIGMPCRFEATAETEPELMQKIALHAKSVHKIDPIPQDLLAKVKKAIGKEEEQPGGYPARLPAILSPGRREPPAGMGGISGSQGKEYAPCSSS